MNNDIRANRYSLKIMDINGNESIIPVVYNGKIMEKMPLSIIDAMTTSYETKEEFKKLLIEYGYNYGYVFIEYKANSKKKTLEVAYGDQEIIKKESKYRENEILAGKKEPKRSENVCNLCHELIEIERHHKKLWSYLQRKNYIWTNLTLAVATYNYMIDNQASPDEIIQFQFDIMKEIGSYSIFRKITLGIEEYYKKYNQDCNEDIVEKTIKQKILKRGE